ncbi:uncharacterized protein LOC108095117 [Drosophila ficusphila]|uniref:uncharacterized protein LOC108095117 n=1 Tax=Drosophila ficusphila TaxID=30025 RepID=UPI0007E7F793|nr:uncharacterized protein LOC108095117 [Drosophila ficusphila]
MMQRHMVHWRVYVYANSLYSLPAREKPDYRDWSPQYFQTNPFEMHRIMLWVNRDISVLVKSGKEDIYILYETVLSLLPCVSMKSTKFRNTFVKYFGLTDPSHFIHELINFARSPYDDLIAYECNTQYKAQLNDDDRPCTSWMAREREILSLRLHNFVEFSLRINHDDCGGFDMDMQLEDEDFGELDDMLLERFNRTFSVEIDREVIGSRVTHQQPPPAAQGQQQSTQQTQQTGQQAGQRQSSQSGQQQATTSSNQQIAGAPFEDLELELAIERSMFDAAQGAGIVLPDGRLVRFANTRVVREARASGSRAGSTNATSSTVRPPSTNSVAQRCRRSRPPYSRPVAKRP